MGISSLQGNSNHSCIEGTLFLPDGEYSSGTGEFSPGTYEEFTISMNTCGPPRLQD
jgi:hypothetical protein